MSPRRDGMFSFMSTCTHTGSQYAAGANSGHWGRSCEHGWQGTLVLMGLTLCRDNKERQSGVMTGTPASADGWLLEAARKGVPG